MSCVTPKCFSKLMKFYAVSFFTKFSKHSRPKYHLAIFFFRFSGEPTFGDFYIWSWMRQSCYTLPMFSGVLILSPRLCPMVYLSYLGTGKPKQHINRQHAKDGHGANKANGLTNYSSTFDLTWFLYLASMSESTEGILYDFTINSMLLYNCAYEAWMLVMNEVSFLLL